MNEKKSNDQILSENIRNNCVIAGLTPYWIDLESGIKLQKTILIGLPIPAKEVDFQDVKRGQTIYLQGKIMPMERANEPSVEAKKMMIDIRDVYAKDNVLMIETADGKLLCSHDFSKEWQQVLEREKDMALVRLAQQAASEKGELYRPATYNLVKSMGFDLKALEFPDNCLCHKRLRNVTSAVHDFVRENRIGQYPSPEYIEQLKKTITESVEDPIKQHQREVLTKAFDYCLEFDKPLIYASDITIFNPDQHRHLPISLDEVEIGEATILTKEQPMHNLDKAVEETNRKAQIENVIRLDGGYLISCAGMIISTLECHDLWVDHMRYRAPERYAAMMLADMIGKAVSEITVQDFKNAELKHSWLEGIRTLPSEQLQEPSPQAIELAATGTITQEWNEYIEQRNATDLFYQECVEKALTDGLEVKNIYDGEQFTIIGPDGSRDLIEKEDIRPGMVILIDDEKPLIVEDCSIVRGDLVVISDNAIFAEKDIELVALNYKDQLERAQQVEPEVQEQNNPEIGNR